jgi:hypothetical protein
LLCRLRVTNFLSWLQIKWILFFSLSTDHPGCGKIGHRLLHYLLEERAYLWQMLVRRWNQAPRCCEAISWG